MEYKHTFDRYINLHRMKKNLLTTALLSGCMIALSAASALAQIYPVSYSNYVVGTQKNGTPVTLGRQTPDRARIPQFSDASTSDAASNFCSLGFNGSIDLAFAEPFMSGPGVDLLLIETSFGNPSCNSHPERARVFVSQTGAPNSWVLAGEGCLNFTLELPANMPWAKYVRVVDISTPSQFANGQDGYDVDGVVAMHRAIPTLNIPTALPGCPTYPYASGQSNYHPGKKKNNGNLPADRSMVSRVLGAPGNDNSGSMNFTSLGFGGEITLEFAYTVIDQAGADIKVYETTWGDSPSHTDASYPEMVDVYGSNDGVNFYLLTAVGENASLPAGRICRDASVDISNMPLIGGVHSVRFLKLIDQSTKASSAFPSSADAYDVDAVVALGCPGTGNRIGDEVSAETEIDEFLADFNYTLAPNPIQSGQSMTLMFHSVLDGKRTVELLDLTGKHITQIADRTFSAGVNKLSWTVGDQSGNALKPGVYMIRIIGADSDQSTALRFVVTQ